MTNEQRQLVRESFQQIQPVADLAGELLYQRLFKIDPALRNLFKPDFRQQGRKLMQMIALIVSNLDRPDFPGETVEELGRRHARFGVQDEHYETVGAALLWTLERCLAGAFTSEVRAAWLVLYVRLADTMKRAAAQVTPIAAGSRA
jgi:hemoglobin-like flavoprotein